ncbi:unnamed protein product [Spodoptera exigua]|nr:unnamed protein product [Spodoptera exigua]
MSTENRMSQSAQNESHAYKQALHSSSEYDDTRPYNAWPVPLWSSVGLPSDNHHGGRNRDNLLGLNKSKSANNKECNVGGEIVVSHVDVIVLYRLWQWNVMPIERAGQLAMLGARNACQGAFAQLAKDYVVIGA